MTCSACEAARTRSSGEYRVGCGGCTARAIARSQVCREALHPNGAGSKRELAELAERLLPGLAVEQRRAMVLDWWRHDRKQQTGSA